MQTFAEYLTEENSKIPKIIWTKQKFKKGFDDFVLKRIGPMMYKMTHTRDEGGRFEEIRFGSKFTYEQLMKDKGKPDTTVREYDSEDEFMGDLTLEEL